MNLFTYIGELYPGNCLDYAECRELAELIDRNHAENGLRGHDRERFDYLIHKAESTGRQRPLRLTDHT